MRNLVKIGLAVATFAGGAFLVSRFRHGKSGTVPVTPHGSTVTPSGQTVVPQPATPNAVSVVGHPDVNVDTSDVAAGGAADLGSLSTSTGDLVSGTVDAMAGDVSDAAAALLS